MYTPLHALTTLRTPSIVLCKPLLQNVASARQADGNVGSCVDPICFDLLLHLLQADVPLLGQNQASCNNGSMHQLAAVAWAIFGLCISYFPYFWLALAS